MSLQARTWYTDVACLYPFGYAPKAPGTWGSLPGVVLGWFLFYLTQNKLPSFINPYFVAVIALSLIGFLSYWFIKKTEQFWDCHDDKKIVIDELIGQAIPLAFFADSWVYLLGSFLLFRFFDIVKPGPIGWIDKNLPGAWGTLLDDVLAGLVVLLFWLLLALV